MADRKTGRTSDQFPLRLPDGMRDLLKAKATANSRSLNAEIVERLINSFAVWPKIDVPPSLYERAMMAGREARDQAEKVANAEIIRILEEAFPAVEEFSLYTFLKKWLPLLTDEKNKEIRTQYIAEARAELKEHEPFLSIWVTESEGTPSVSVGIENPRHAPHHAFVAADKFLSQTTPEIIPNSKRPTKAEWNELRAAPNEFQGEILEALANVEIDRALQIAREASRKKGAA